MRLTKKLTAVFMICVVVCTFLVKPVEVVAQKDGVDRNAVKSLYDAKEKESRWHRDAIGEYPIDVEDAEWKKLSYKEAVAACNMPETYAKSLQTSELVEYAINYPLLMDVFLFDTVEDGINHLVETSVVFQELSSRKDSMDELVKAYSEMNCDYEVLEKTNCMSKSNYDKKFFIEAYMGVNYNNISQDTKKKFIEEYDKKFEEQSDKVKSYAMSSVFYQGIQEVLHYIPKDAVTENVKKHNIVNSVSNELSFVKTSNKCVGLFFNALYYQGYEIIDGKEIECYQHHMFDYSDPEKEARANKIAINHPTFVKLKDATQKYNCHSYAWYATNAFKSMYNKIYIDDPMEIILDTDYYEVWYSYMGTPKEGSRVAFFQGDKIVHSAVITDYPTCRSKLGYEGVYYTTISELEAFYRSTHTEILLEVK